MSSGTRAGRTSASRVSCSRASFALLASALWLAPTAARAESSPLVVVLSSNPEAPFVRRLAAELSLFGYRVEVAGRDSADGELTAVLARHHGAALISVDQGRQTAEVVVAAQPGTTEQRRELERLDPRRRADTNAAVLAERFRARLTELGIAPAVQTAQPPRSPGKEAMPTPNPSPTRARERMRRLWLAGSVGASAGGLGVVPDAALELRAFPVRWLSTSAFGKLSLGRAQVAAPEGSADVRFWSGGLLIDAYPVRGDLSINVGVGALLVDAEMSGRASPPWQGRDVSVLVPAAIFEGGAALRLTPRVSAEVRAFVGACSPRVAVRIAEQNVASFGQPLVGASFGVAVGVF
ncbi:MAG: hypothetical protein EOO73_34300 [Myxococcales bacterium]|nr:MAG: hypothetical protein EOO73_34300 [Myxococcales bacterium]